MEIFLDVLKNKYADFEGRARRKEYWTYVLFLLLAFLLAYFILLIGIALESAIIGGLGGILVGVVGLGTFIPSLAVAVRRLHDTNRSGWFYLLGIIPLVGLIVLVWFCTEGTKGANDFGPDPKGGNEIGEIGSDDLV
ncbi:MAG: DUF805 domain-containing protein [Saprospiraceae bacterium]|nr:DUF805 domain-containing protein [Saprospiraceae bacterium]